MIHAFVLMMLGHFVGDYLLQNQWMALNKSKPGWIGFLACTLHVVLYTASVEYIASVYNPLALALIFIPHWLIDRFSLAKPFLKWKNGGRGMDDIFKVGDTITQEKIWEASFSAPVYIMNDNTMHFLCLLAIAKLFF